MIRLLLKTSGKAAVWLTKRKLARHPFESSLVLGAVGVAVTARAAYLAQQQETAVRGKVVVIAGGSRGLGLEIAREFGLHGAHLVLASRKEDELQKALHHLQTEGAIPNAASAHIVVADVSKQEDCERLIASAVERYGRVDVLVNCAAIMQVAPFEDQTTDAFHKAMDVNFFGQLYAIQAVLPHMLAQGHGRIVNIASVGGKIGVPHMLPYVASKFALVGFGEGLHAELRHRGIRVTTVCPGLMRTGAHVQVQFAGDAEKEYRWFAFGATAPGVSISARAAAQKIYAAAVAGKAEITITPQAWLGARLVGLAPAASQAFAAAVTHLFLPAPNGNKTTVQGSELASRHSSPLDRWTNSITAKHNQSVQ